MNSDSNKNLFIAFAIIVPLLLAIACIAVISGQTDPFQAIQEARKPRTVLDDLSDMRMRYSEKKWEEALQAAREALQKHPGDEEALRGVAAISLKLKRPGEAAAALKMLVKDVPEDIPTRVIYAQALTMIGERDEALNEWKAISEHPYSTVQERRQARKALSQLSPEYQATEPNSEEEKVPKDSAGKNDENSVQ
ncbi:MAG: tetratricopeptide repeat protein [Armatimonas sp.]